MYVCGVFYGYEILYIGIGTIAYGLTRLYYPIVVIEALRVTYVVMIIQIMDVAL